jgi:hypothetical protein
MDRLLDDSNDDRRRLLKHSSDLTTSRFAPRYWLVAFFPDRPFSRFRLCW